MERNNILTALLERAALSALIYAVLFQVSVADVVGSQMTVAAMSDDGAVVLLADEAGVISAWRVANGKRVWGTDGTRQLINDVGFGGTGRHVVTLEGDRLVRISRLRDTADPLLLDYMYKTRGEPAYTIASGFVGPSELIVGSSGSPKAYLLNTERLASEQVQVRLESYLTQMSGFAGYGNYSAGGLPLSKSVLARIDNGSNPGDDTWTDFAGCPKKRWAIGTTREGYLLAWNIDRLVTLPDELGIPTLKPEYQRRGGGVKAGGVRALRGVACSAAGYVATIGEGGDDAGEIQIWNLNGERVASTSPQDATLHGNAGCRIAWDTTGRYLVSADRSEYVVWSWGGKGEELVRLTTLALGKDRSICNGRPAVSPAKGQFVLLSGGGAWLYDAVSRLLVREYGDPAQLRAQSAAVRVLTEDSATSPSGFFGDVLAVVEGSAKVSALRHPLFTVHENREVNLGGTRFSVLVTFSCSFGESAPSFADARRECVRHLQPKWREFLEESGFELRLVNNASLPGWIRVLFTAHRDSKEQLQYLYESETNRNASMGYAKISLIRARLPSGREP